jgi:hypothetical protein
VPLRVALIACGSGWPEGAFSSAQIVACIPAGGEAAKYLEAGSHPLNALLSCFSKTPDCPG